MKIFLFVYNLLFPLALLLLLPGALLRMVRRGNYARNFGQRLGWYAKETREILLGRRGEWVWVHAVSVGEVLVALRMIRELQQSQEIPVLLSTTTSTGYSLAAKSAGETVEVIYHPVDIWPTVRRVVGWVRPRALELVEAEIWPNLAFCAARQGAKILLVNARLSQRSERRYRSMRWLASCLYRLPDRICLQEESDRNRFLGIGAEAEKLEVTGSIKFDQAGGVEEDPASCRAILRELEVAEESKILLGASTHPGEEAILAECYRSLRRTHPDLFLVLVPRHAERGERVAGELEKMGFEVQRCSRTERGPCDILLVDTTGDLRRWTRVATLVFVGKSLVPGGGQNPAEAIAAGKPVLFGPHMQNFSALVELVLAVRGAEQVASGEELQQACSRLLDDPGAAIRMAVRAKSALDCHSGATLRSVQLLLALLDSPGTAQAGVHSPIR